MPATREPLLRIRDLSVCYRADGEPPVVALDRASLEIAPGEALGVLGESGCGKTSLALAIPGLLPPGGEITGSVELRGRRLDSLDERRLEAVRGAEIGLVFQEPTLALHPTRRVGGQIAEVLQAPLHPYTQALLRCIPPLPTETARMERCDGEDPQELRRGGRRVWCFAVGGEAPESK